MTESQISKLDDLHPAAVDGPAAPDCAPLLGTWVNTRPSAPDLVDVTIRALDGGLGVRIRSATPEGPRDWGEVRADAYHSIEEERNASIAMRAVFALEDSDVAAQIRYTKGLVVVGIFRTVKDGSGRSSHFAREFFARA